MTHLILIKACTFIKFKNKNALKKVNACIKLNASFILTFIFGGTFHFILITLINCLILYL